LAGNVLIVDDAPETLKLLKEILSAEGYKTRPFSSGEMALRSIASEVPELILLDVRMPGMDGLEVCRQIKKEKRLKDIPVIFISGATDTEDKLKAFQAGGVDYITKPFQREEVLARARTHVALHRSKIRLQQAEAKLKKSEQSLVIAQAVAHLGHWEMDVDTSDVSWSDETFRIFGLHPHDIKPSYDAFLSVVHPDDRARIAECIQSTRKGGEFDVEYRIVLPDGRERMVHGKGVLVAFRDSNRGPEIIGTVQSVTEMVGVLQDITERKEMEWRLEKEARTDSLTGCALRRYFFEIADQEFARSGRHGADLSVLMLDLDRFKSINDAYGHHAGDLTLKKLVQVCGGILRQEDLLGRLGGEEFAVLLVETGPALAFEVAERLREAIAAAEVGLDDGTCMRFTTSVGLASKSADDPDFAAILKRADAALYEAKNTGRNRVCT